MKRAPEAEALMNPGVSFVGFAVVFYFLFIINTFRQEGEKDALKAPDFNNPEHPLCLHSRTAQRGEQIF